MSVPTTAELSGFLQEHGFLTPLQLQHLRENGHPAFADARTLARDLVERNWLTSYQADQLLLGRGQDLLVGPYRILDRLGEGGMGQVFKAHHVSMDRIIALKIIPKDRMCDPAAVGRFQREVRAVAKLSHPNIVIAFEVNQVGQTPFLAMEYVDGVDLARLVQQSGPLPIPRACEYVRQAAIGLEHAHERGLVHRDIKPGNLMVARPSPHEPPVIKILDFGLARFESESAHSARLTQLGKVVGTVDYMAPEQAHNPRTADIRADLYSLGCTLFYLLSGKPPFPGEDAVEKISARMFGDAPSVRKSRPEASPELERVLTKMMARDPRDRYQTPDEVAKALKPYTRDERQALHAAMSIPVKSPVSPKSPAMAKALAQTFTAPQLEFGSSPSGYGRLPRRRVIGPVGILLAGAVALMGVLLGLIVLVATNGDSDSKKRQELTDDPQGNSKENKPIERPPKQIINSIAMKLVLIPAGEFLIGSLDSKGQREPKEWPQHKVRIRNSFYMGVYEVTQGQYQKVMGDNPSGFKASLDHPVEQVVWDEAVEFCRNLSELPEERKLGRVYQLPTEAEWEYACRAGTKTPFHFGTSLSSLQANINGEGPCKVGSYEPNAFGLYDMHGNVWEWCLDGARKYTEEPQENPMGELSRQAWRVRRGGSWKSVVGEDCRSAIRYPGDRLNRWNDLGFRIVMVMPK